MGNEGQRNYTLDSINSIKGEIKKSPNGPAEVKELEQINEEDHDTKSDISAKKT
jgi:hypothetical protein